MDQDFLALILILFSVGCAPAEANKEEAPYVKAKDTDSIGSVDTLAKMAIAASAAPIVTSYPVPGELDISANLPEEWCPGQYGCLRDIFRPIGWSEDARYFAYALEPALEARDGYELEVIVQDAALDSIVWRWKYGDDDRGEQPQKQENSSSIEAVWRSHQYDEISDSLRSYTITPYDTVPKVYSTPITVTDSVYHVVREDDYYDNPNFGVRQIIRETFWVKQNGTKEKRVYTAEYGEYSLILRSTATGAVLAPNQSRMLLVNVYEKRGWEGPPNVLSVRFIGCRLKNF